MAKNYVTEKLKIVFRGPWMIYWREKRGGNKSVRLVLVLRRLVYDLIPDEVKKEHNITKALKDQDKVENIAREVDENAYKVAFNVEIELEEFLELLDKVEDWWTNLRERVGARTNDEAKLLAELNRSFQKDIDGLLRQFDKDERYIYFNLLEPVIKEAESSEGKETMMAKVAQMFKTKDDVSRFAAIAFKWEARAARRKLTGLRKDTKGLRNIIKRYQHGATPKQMANSLKELDTKIIGNAKKEFQNTFVLLKRDLLLELVLLGLLNKENKEMWDYVKEHLMPRAPELQNDKDLQAVRAEIAEHAHVLAQGLRRLISEESAVEAKARSEMAKADKIKIKPSKKLVKV